MKNIFKLALAAALSGGVATLHAATLDTTTATPDDGILQNFTGFDWNSNGAGWIQGFDLTAANLAGDMDTFTFTYQAFANTIQTTTPTSNLYVASPGSATGTYEVTTFSTITETATCNNDGCSSITITLDSGTFDIYFDTTPDANQLAGTGLTDGVNIISGTWDGGLTTFTATGPVGPGVIGVGGGVLSGTVTSTNSTYVDPDLVGSLLQASLFFPGQSAPSYTRPVLFNGVATGADTATDFVLQTDTSQDFTAIPEPAVLAMLGLGLLGLPLAKRLRAAKVSG